MITASHNPYEDNGVKLVDPMVSQLISPSQAKANSILGRHAGGLCNYLTCGLSDTIQQAWEGYATTLANSTASQIGESYEKIVNEELTDDQKDRPAKVVFARDTRESGPALVKAVKASLDILGVEYTDLGILTTPQLHYIVRCINTKGTPYEFGEPTEQAYYEKMAKAFKTLMHGRTIKGPITVDCANGVGGPKLKELIKYMPKEGEGAIEIKVINDNVIDPKALNYEVSH